MKKTFWLRNITLLIILLSANLFAAVHRVPVSEIPFEYKMDKIIVPVSINGSQNIPAILDTGMPAGVFIMNPETAKPLKLEYASTSVRVGGAGTSTVTASMALGNSVNFASIPLENQRVIVMNEAGPISRIGVDAVIGASVFNKYVVEIDVEKKLIRLFKPADFDSTRAGDSFDLTIVQTKPHVYGLVNILGDKELKLEMVIDTGANASLFLTEKEENKVSAPEKSISGTIGRGVGGVIRGRSARIKSLKLGKHQFENMVVRFQKDQLPGNADGLIGMKVLERFLVTFDYPGKRMFLKPNGSYKDPFEFSMTGLAIVPDEKNRLKVMEVYPNSPAGEAGIKSGDILFSVNGKKLGFSDYTDFAESLITPGKEVVFEFERDGQRFRKILKLKRLL